MPFGHRGMNLASHIVLHCHLILTATLGGKACTAEKTSEPLLRDVARDPGSHSRVGTWGCWMPKPLLSRHGWCCWGPCHVGIWLASVLPLNRFLSFNSLGHRKLKTHLQHLRWKGSKSGSQEYKEKSCARCRQALGLLLNRGAVCQGCSHRVCAKCRVFLRMTRAWKCTVCFEDR